MGPTEIGLLIVAGVTLMAAIAYIAQSVEDARRERQLKLMNLRYEIRRANHLLTSFPQLFLTTDIQQLLIRYLQHKWEMMVELEEKPENQAQLDKVKAMHKASIDTFLHPEGSLTAFPDMGAAAQAQGLLLEFLKFLLDAEKKGDISKTIRESFEKRARQAHSRIACELEIFEALAIEGMNGGTAALPKLRNCFFKLDNINRDHSMDRQLYELRTYVDNLAAEKAAEEKQREEERRINRLEEERYNNMTF